MNNTAHDKRALRAEAMAARRLARQRGGAEAAARVAELALGAVPFAGGAAIAGYWPIGDELDDRPLLGELAARGHTIALPAVERRGAPLLFRRWRTGDRLEVGEHGIPAPPESAPALEPDAVIVPLLAFDGDGYRLGYGGGYYDRSLAALRRRKKILAVGVAFAVQEMPRLPREPGDERLDWIVTELAARAIAGNEVRT